jgi:hypothetical protein
MPCGVPEHLAAVDVMRVTTACVAGDEPVLIGGEKFWLDEFTIREVDQPS